MSEGQRGLLTLVMVCLLGLLTVAGVGWLAEQPQSDQVPDTWSYAQLLHQAQAGRVRDLTISGDIGLAVDRQGRSHRIVLPSSTDRLAQQLAGEGVQVSFQDSGLESVSRWLLGSAFPVIFVVLLGFFVLARLRGGDPGSLVVTSPARPARPETSRVTFGQVAGAEEAKRELEEVVEFLRSPERFTSVGARVPRGVLLVGPPGTGKTLLARAVAGQAGVPFLTASGPGFVEMYVGLGAARVRALFAQARECAPCIVFIDEIDALGRRRQRSAGADGGERDQTLNQLLVEMDGFGTGAGLIVIAATNRPDVLDPALLRPGRFDRRIQVDLPDVEGRREILAVHTRGKPLAAEVDLEALARQTAGFSGADLANLVNEAAIAAAEAGRRAVAMADLEEALLRAVAGPRRSVQRPSGRQMDVLAYHQAGHVLVMRALPGCDPVRAVSLGARGRKLGWMLGLPGEEHRLLARGPLADRLAGLLGGRVAEELVFGDVSTAAEDDIAEATRLAWHMVARWGMSPEVGQVAIASALAGTAGAPGGRPSRKLAARAEVEVAAILGRAQETARRILEGQRRRLETLASRLLATETIEGPELERLLASIGADPASAPRAGRREVSREGGPVATGQAPSPSLVGPIGAAGGSPRRTA
ncbi:MAG TPA: ATP-dependent zinc metalloprotease FtsH [Candidatus Dormibacteraeota bacterium]|nr:ATP-dependent zinc metalloprotease FtsH [Candidatus Dormibacteraeota bacterium]